MKRTQVAEQVTAKIREFVAPKCDLARVLYPPPDFALFASLLILGRLHPCSIFCPISTDIFSIMEDELALMQSMKVISL